MSQLKKVQVVMLPTKEKANLQLNVIHNNLWNNKFEKNKGAEILTQPYQHLYFLSDEEIKEGDWFITTAERDILQCTKVKKGNISVRDAIYADKRVEYHILGKIIASTRKLPLNDVSTPWTLEHKYTPQPSQSFLEKYVEAYNKGKQIKEVMVEYYDNVPCISDEEYNAVKNGKLSYKDTNPFLIQVLKISPKDNTITIRPIKTSWSREEIIQLLHKFAKDEGDFTYNGDNPSDCFISVEDVNKWIVQNL